MKEVLPTLARECPRGLSGIKVWTEIKTSPCVFVDGISRSCEMYVLLNSAGKKVTWTGQSASYGSTSSA